MMARPRQTTKNSRRTYVRGSSICCYLITRGGYRISEPLARSKIDQIGENNKEGKKLVAESDKSFGVTKCTVAA